MDQGKSPGLAALSEKEKQTLRLIVRGHDAKSIARHLDLSVHTINERLRDARRKLAVPSSREAARLLFDREGGDPRSADPQSPVPDEIGEAGVVDAGQEGGRRRWMSHPAALVGVPIMTIALALLALAGQVPSVPAAPVPVAPAESAVTAAALDFLQLLDRARWADAYALTGSGFRNLNSRELWTDVSNKVRAPLGAASGRTLLSQQSFPAPPDGYEVVRFRTSFASRSNAIETVTLAREQGAWRVVAVLVE